MSEDSGRISSLATTRDFLSAGTCSETLARALDRALGHPAKLEERGISLNAGGIMRYGYQCGMIWGATLAAGAQAYRLYGADAKAETAAIMAAQKLVESFRNQNHCINCSEITNIDRSSSTLQMIAFFLLKGGTIHCIRMAAKYARLAYDDINTVLAEKHPQTNSYPASCSAILAQKLGATDKHIIMAAGFAGGIGLCGGGCGALGATLWIIGMRSAEEHDGKVNFNDPKAAEVIDRFMKSTDYEFECAKITGRKFNGIDEHAEYIRSGGCREILDTLTSI